MFGSINKLRVQCYNSAGWFGDATKRQTHATPSTETDWYRLSTANPGSARVRVAERCDKRECRPKTLSVQAANRRHGPKACTLPMWSNAHVRFPFYKISVAALRLADDVQPSRSEQLDSP